MANQRQPVPGGDSAGIGAFGLWVLVLFTLLGVSIAPVLLFHVDLRHFSTSRTPAIALVGLLLSAYTPTIAAAVVALAVPSTGGLRALLRPLLRWRVSMLWYLMALVAPVGIGVAADLLHEATGGSAPKQWLILPSGFAVALFIGSVIAGAVGEEFGWRGFAQRILQGKWGGLAAALAVALVWSAWHLWPAVVPGTQMTYQGAVGTIVLLGSLSVIYAWIWNGAASLLLVMLAHAGYNIAGAVVGSPADGADLGPLQTGFYLAWAAILVAMTSPQTLRFRHGARKSSTP